MTTNTEITRVSVITDRDHLGDMPDSMADGYCRALAARLHTAFPNAEIETIMRQNGW